MHHPVRGIKLTDQLPTSSGEAAAVAVGRHHGHGRGPAPAIAFRGAAWQSADPRGPARRSSTTWSIVSHAPTSRQHPGPTVQRFPAARPRTCFHRRRTQGEASSSGGLGRSRRIAQAPRSPERGQLAQAVRWLVALSCSEQHSASRRTCSREMGENGSAHDRCSTELALAKDCRHGANSPYTWLKHGF